MSCPWSHQSRPAPAQQPVRAAKGGKGAQRAELLSRGPGIDWLLRDSGGADLGARDACDTPGNDGHGH